MFIAEVVILVSLLVATVQDLKSREVADWLSYMTGLAGIGLVIINSLDMQSILPVIYGLSGLVIGVIIGFSFYFAGVWGGGDAKLLMALSILFGLNWQQSLSNILNEQFISFLINSVIVSAPYALLWAVITALRKKSEFLTAWKKEPINEKVVGFSFIIILMSVILSITQHSIGYVVYIAGILVFMNNYLLRFVKATDKGCMVVAIPPSALVEGDWLEEKVRISKEKSLKRTPTGLDKNDILLLQKAYQKNIIGKVKVKQGLPFIPVFLFGFLSVYAVGNIVSFLLL